MSKKVKIVLKLLFIPELGVELGESDFVWATKAEMQEYIKQGYVRFLTWKGDIGNGRK